jgi:hypothetical protein
VVGANPATVSALGGSTTITANVVDVNGNALGSTPVTFSTTAGTLSVGLATTDQNGNAQTVLTTAVQATVTATVGVSSGGTGGTGGGTTTAQTATVTVNVTAAPTLQITPPSTPPSAGLPASFTFTVTAAQNGGTVRNVAVSWGDGQNQNLGAVNGSAVVSHVYVNAGTYTVSATVTDSFGNTNSVSTSVTVIPVPRPTIIVTPSPQSAPGGSVITFTINIQAPAGVAIQDVVIDFGDPTFPPQDLGGVTGIVTVPHSYPAGVRTYTVTVRVTDSTGQVTTGSTSVSITT